METLVIVMASACEKVFAIPELLEIILLAVADDRASTEKYRKGFKQLFLIQSVTKAFRTTIEMSLKLQRAMFLVEDPTAPTIDPDDQRHDHLNRNPLLRKGGVIKLNALSLFAGEPGDRDAFLRINSATKRRTAFDHPRASWRRTRIAANTADVDFHFGSPGGRYVYPSLERKVSGDYTLNQFVKRLKVDAAGYETWAE